MPQRGAASLEAREQADLDRLVQDGLEALRLQDAKNATLIAAGGLHPDARDAPGLEPACEACVALCIVGEASIVRPTLKRHIQMRLGDIDPGDLRVSLPLFH